MIKCNVTVCGVIGRDASIRTNKEGKTFLVFPLRVMIPDTDGKTMPIEVDVSKDTAGKEVSKYRNGSRIEVSGTMYLKHRGDKLYFNLFINEIRTATADAKDTVKGELVFRGKVGQHIEEKRDKKDQPYTMFSAFSTEKVEDGFEYQWVRFFCFGKEREAWLQPGVRVDAKGEISLSAYNGKLNVSCKVEELVQYVADSSNSNPRHRIKLLENISEHQWYGKRYDQFSGGSRSHILFICSHKIKNLLFSLSPPARYFTWDPCKTQFYFFTKFFRYFWWLLLSFSEEKPERV